MNIINLYSKQQQSTLYTNNTTSSKTFQQKAQKILSDFYHTNYNFNNDSHSTKLKLFISPRKEGNQLSDKIYKAKFDFINRKEFKLKNCVLLTQNTHNSQISRNTYTNQYNQKRKSFISNTPKNISNNTNTNTHYNNRIHKTLNDLLKESSSHNHTQTHINTNINTNSNVCINVPFRSMTPKGNRLNNSKRITLDSLLTLSNKASNKPVDYFLNY